MNMNILVFGGSGKIGAAVACLLDQIVYKYLPSQGNGSTLAGFSPLM